MNVHVLATCRKPELLPYTTLVFDTIRVGFPKATIHVHFNRLKGESADKVLGLCKKVSAKTTAIDTIHHEWIEQLIETEQEPFWIVDTDVIFYGSFEHLKFDDALAGWRIPEWQDEYSGAITRSRLHPSLLYINPLQVKTRLELFKSTLPKDPFTPFCNPVYPLCLPMNGKMYFHDTMSLMYQAIGGQAFTDAQKDKFFHFNFGTIPDLVLNRLKNGEQMGIARRHILEHPESGKGMWRGQEKYYELRQSEPEQDLAIPEIKPEDAKAAIEWNKYLCKGDAVAMQCSDLWYQFCHGVDDILDTMEDGRPKMSKAQILSVFFKAMMFYNCPFFVANRMILFPTAILSHNMFADSVEWEKSPLRRRRLMADAMRTSGDEMYFAMALLKGGEAHMRDISPKIRERDWIGQHDENDQPN